MFPQIGMMFAGYGPGVKLVLLPVSFCTSKCKVVNQQLRYPRISLFNYQSQQDLHFDYEFQFVAVALDLLSAQYACYLANLEKPTTLKTKYQVVQAAPCEVGPCLAILA